MGEALDFSVQGIPNEDLFRFIKTLPKSGKGFYPNSKFVHIDNRNNNGRKKYS